jgi:diguanylate cyclase (GGDEF)-like protein
MAIMSCFYSNYVIAYFYLFGCVKMTYSRIFYTLAASQIQSFFNYPKNLIYLHAFFGVCLLIIFISITVILSKRQKRISQMLYNNASTDSLTGISNYSKFCTESTHLFQTHLDGTYAIITFDINHFKIINDTLGFAFGDQVLVAAANNLKSILAKEEPCCRISTDVFAFCVKANPDTHMLDLIQTMIDRMSKLTIDNQKIAVKLCFGIYVVAHKETDIRGCVDNASLTRKQIKNCSDMPYAYYDEKTQKIMMEEATVQDDLEIALKQNQFEMYYQPQICFRTGKVMGMEALIRWKHPQKGFISPGYFIPIAEKCGLIFPISKFVFEQVCRDIKEWKKYGKQILVSVNISRADLFQTNFIEMIQEATAQYKIDTHLIDIELTETTAINDLEFIKEIIGQLKALGFMIAMDDFGTGYSSLSCLRTIPLDLLKLDRSFLQDLDKDKKSSNIVYSIVKLAKSLGFCVVAEGVETKAEADILHNIGCDIAQGYYFAKPMSKQSFEDFTFKTPNNTINLFE